MKRTLILQVVIGLLMALYTYSAAAQGTASGPITCTSINTVACVSPTNPQQWAGADAGAWINSAIASVGCGTVELAAGQYIFKTQINKPRCVSLIGQYGGTFLDYRGTGAAIAVHDAGSRSFYQGGIRGIYMGGPGHGSGTTAIYFGGDPAGLISSTSDFADFQTMNDIVITNFGTAIKFGNNVFFDLFYALVLQGNGVGVLAPSGITNTGEQIAFFGGSLSSSYTSDFQNDAGALASFYGTSFDGTPPFWTGTALIGHCYNCHFEEIALVHSGGSNTTPFIDATNGCQCFFDGGEWLSNPASGTESQWIKVGGSLDNILTFTNVSVISNHAVAQIINWTGTASNPPPWLDVRNIYNNTNGKIGAAVNSALLTPATQFVGEHIDVNNKGFTTNRVHIDGAALNRPQGQVLHGPQVTSGADATLEDVGEVRRVIYKATVSGTTCVGASGFIAASTNADCVIATFPARTEITRIVVDNAAGFTCSGTCTGTKTIQVGKTTGGAEYLLAKDATVIATYGLDSGHLGVAMATTASTQIGAGDIPSWGSTTTIKARYVSGRGNWGNGSTTFVNAGSTTFYIETLLFP